MSTPEAKIAYYVHHHGHGHLSRARAIAAHLDHAVTIFSSLVDDDVVSGITYRNLAQDYDESVVAENFLHFHYAPLSVASLRNRAMQLTQWFNDNWPCLIVIDVSVEIAMLARLCGVPAIYVRQRGNRSDAAHAMAYATASRLLAPYPEAWEQPGVSPAIRSKTDFTGLISRYEERISGLPVPATHTAGRKKLTVITGFGGSGLTSTQLVDAARACPDWDWNVIGPIGAPSHWQPGGNIAFVGPVDDPVHYLLDADVVIGSAGDSLVSELAHLRRRFICLPEKRPYDEQLATAALLKAQGVALVCTDAPPPADWPHLLDTALSIDTACWDRMVSGGARDAARCISRTVANTLDMGRRWTS